MLRCRPALSQSSGRIMLPRDPAPDEISHLLDQWSAGDAEALNRLMELLYRELRRLAHAYMRRERPGNTLQTTAVVNELYLRLAAQRRRFTPPRTVPRHISPADAPHSGRPRKVEALRQTGRRRD